MYLAKIVTTTISFTILVNDPMKITKTIPPISQGQLENRKQCESVCFGRFTTKDMIRFVRVTLLYDLNDDLLLQYTYPTFCWVLFHTVEPQLQKKTSHEYFF